MINRQRVYSYRKHMETIKLERMDEPNIYGYCATREDGIQVEVVQCYENQWNVFLTRESHVVARSVAEYRICQNGYLTRREAFKLAQTLLRS